MEKLMRHYETTQWIAVSVEASAGAGFSAGGGSACGGDFGLMPGDLRLRLGQVEDPAALDAGRGMVGQ
ncbi:MAG: hypothetical protein WCP22_11530 [Chlamydiota bacterium]